MRLTKEQSKALFQKARKEGTSDLRDFDTSSLDKMEQKKKPARSKPTSRPKPVKRSSGMNRTESRYEAEVLKPLLSEGKILSYYFERFKYKIGIAKCWYTVDFMVVWPTHIEMVEIKGHWEDDALVKFKSAADQYDFFEWSAVQWKRGWETWNPHEGCRRS